MSVAQLPVVRAGTGATRCSNLLTGLSQQYPRFTMVYAADLSGDVFCSSGPGSMNVAQSDYFQQVLRTHDFAISSYRIGRMSGKPVVTFAYPILDPAGRVTGAVAAGLDLGWLNDFAARSRLPAGAV